MRRLGQLEAVLMNALWSAAEPLTVREVLESLPTGSDRAYTTIMTVLDNLHRKGLVDRRLDNRAYRYWPSESRERYTATLMEEALSAAADRDVALLHFVERISPQEAASLRAALDELGSSGPA